MNNISRVLGSSEWLMNSNELSFRVLKTVLHELFQKIHGFSFKMRTSTSILHLLHKWIRRIQLSKVDHLSVKGYETVTGQRYIPKQTRPFLCMILIISDSPDEYNQFINWELRCEDSS